MVGEIIHDDHVLFGPAVLRAYELEQRVAIYPRVIIDDNVVPIMSNNPFCRITQDRDGYWFVDPFTISCRTATKPHDPTPPVTFVPNMTAIQNIRDFILTQLTLQSAFPDRVAKYRWLAGRFNEMIGEWPAEDLAPISLTDRLTMRSTATRKSGARRQRER